MAKQEDKIVFYYQDFGEVRDGGIRSSLANVTIEGLAGYHIGLPATGDRKTDIIALLRRIANVMEHPDHY